MEAKVFDDMEGIRRSKSSDEKERDVDTPRIPKEGLLNDEEEGYDDEYYDASEEKMNHRAVNSPRIPREGLLQGEEDDDDNGSSLDSDDELDEDDDVTLEEIVTWVEETRNRITELEEKLQRTGHTKSGINRILDELAKQYGLLEDMQYENDDLKLSTAEEKAIRKEQTSKMETLFTRISKLEEDCGLHMQKIVEVEKEKGNDEFKAGNYKKAVKHYTEAISADNSGNASLYTNRALAYQKMGELNEGLADAKAAARMDANLLKAYIIMSKIQISLKRPVDSKETLESIPMAYSERPEVLELLVSTAQCAKELGNAYLKEGITDEAIRMYTVAIGCDPNNHLLYSNRSAAYQKKLQWPQAIKDAESCLKINATFAKGYVHLGRSQIQLKRWDDASATVTRAESILPGEEFTVVKPQMTEIMSAAKAGKQGMSGGPSSSTSSMSNEARAESLKEKGNVCYRNEQYQDAVRLYSQAIAALPSKGIYYGNRAAAWMMLKEFKRAAADCVEGISLERVKGECDKVRGREASALAAMGKIDTAINKLEEALLIEDRVETSGVAALEKQLDQMRTSLSNFNLGTQSLQKNEYTRARRLFQLAANVMTSDPRIQLGMAKACIGLGEYDDASREAQKVIALNDKSLGIEAYTVRAEALMATGATELASKHLSAALQQDPDNKDVASKLKSLRRMISETTRVRAAVDAAMNKRDYQNAITHCTEGISIDKSAKKLMAEFHGRRANAYSKLAKVQLRTPPAAPKEGASESEIEASSPKALSLASWKRVLQDCNTCIYYEGQTVPSILLKVEALQAMDKHEEAVSELESCHESGPGKEDSQVRMKLQEAKRLLKKSKRVNLYEILGCPRGEMSSEQEIAKAYKKMALKWHPDRHSSKGEEAKKQAEEQFKTIQDAHELLMDPQRRKLYDEGYDRDEIEQQMEMQKQGHNGRGHQGFPGGSRGHGGFSFGF